MIFGLRRSSPPVIRPLRPDKAEACARLHAKGFAHPWSAQEVAALIASASTLAAAALDPANGRLRGFVLSRLAVDEAEILTIAVEAASRGKGEGDVPRSRQRQCAGAGVVRAARVRQGRRTRRLLSPQ
jgi:ribosomal protein S18 acetylase RimI-like enzyme